MNLSAGASVPRYDNPNRRRWFLSIGEHTHIQPRCQFSAYKSSIQIGNRVEIAPNCAFYSYDHVCPDRPVRDGLADHVASVGDEAWLGVGVIVLDGVRIGKGAVIGAGSVVARDVPDNAVAFGVPARVVKMRNGPVLPRNG